MLRKLRAAQRWSLLYRLAIAATVLVATCLLQLPIERQVPGEPFLLFALVVIGTTLVFGKAAGFFAAGLSTFLSFLFFEPVGSLSILYAADLIKIELYAVLAAGCVLVFSLLGDALSAASDSNEVLRRQNVNKSILLRELGHGVANNFAIVAARIRAKCTGVKDSSAKAVLEEAIEQVNVIGRVHRRLRAGNQDVSLDSSAFFPELCNDLRAMVLGRPLSIACRASSYPLCMDQAVTLGLYSR